MFVIADLEWVSDWSGDMAPTQLAAIRVDENWQARDRFQALMRPQTRLQREWNHVAFTGYTPLQFVNAKTPDRVLTDFEEWLGEKDVILWWFDDSRAHFRKFFQRYRKKETDRALYLNRPVAAYLKRPELEQYNPYRLAEDRGQEAAGRNHCAESDAETVRRVLEGIGMPQKVLSDLLLTRIQEEPYVYDAETRRLHRAGCRELLSSPALLRGIPTVAAGIKKRLVPCACCREAFFLSLAARNLKVAKCYTYLFSPDSKVFHRPDCSVVKAMRVLTGCNCWEEALADRRPCRLCRPEKAAPVAPKIPTPEELAAAQMPPQKQIRAMERQKAAVLEREARMEKARTREEKKDIFTLTQTRFVFWAARGFGTFHQRNCPKMKGLSDLVGFSRYGEARRAGYAPCRHCKPDPKQDLVYSVPFRDRSRAENGPEVLTGLCEENGFSCRQEKHFFFMETPVGKWRVHLKGYPVMLDHVNLVTGAPGADFHRQPRVFLSYSDLFTYVKRHDEVLSSRTGLRAAQ